MALTPGAAAAVARLILRLRPPSSGASGASGALRARLLPGRAGVFHLLIGTANENAASPPSGAIATSAAIAAIVRSP
jgi:hypothetical protein